MLLGPATVWRRSPTSRRGAVCWAVAASLALAAPSPAAAQDPEPEPAPPPALPAPDPAPPAPAPPPRRSAPTPSPPASPAPPPPVTQSVAPEVAPPTQPATAPQPAPRRPRAKPKPAPKPVVIRRLPTRDPPIVRTDDQLRVLGVTELVRSGGPADDGVRLSMIVLAAWFGLGAAMLLLAGATPLIGERLTLRRGQIALAGTYMLVGPTVGYLVVVATS